MLTVERGVTLRTIESYRRDLDLFEKFLGKFLDQERSSDKGENVSEMSNEIIEALKNLMNLFHLNEFIILSALNQWILKALILR